MRSTHWKAALLAGVSLIALGTGASAQNTNIGQVAAVNSDMDGTPPNDAKRQLLLGLGVFENERVETSDQGSGQLLFLDQTSLTVSQNSDIKLDKYVYDPGADAGDMAMSMSKGALRFIGGRITKKRRAMIRTPTATIGIRGGLVIIRVRPDGSTRVVQMAGDSTEVVSYGDADGDGIDDGPDAGEQETFFSGAPVDEDGVIILSRPGAKAEVFPSPSGSGGQRPPSDVSFDGIVTPEELSQEYEGFEGGRSGGTDQVPTDQGVNEASEEIASVNSGQQGGQNNQPVSTSGEKPPTPPEPTIEIAETPSPLSDPLVQPLSVEEQADIDEEEDPGQDPVDPPVDPAAVASGAITIDGSGVIPLANIRNGSIIGDLVDPIFGVESVVLDLPENAGDLAPTNQDGQSFFAQTRFPLSGFFEVGAEFLPGGDAFTAEGFAVFLEPDLPEFVVAEIPGADALVFFGNATPGQDQAFVADAPAAGANSITGYRVDAADDTTDALVNVISNGPGDPDGGRVLFAELRIDSDAGERELSVAAGRLGRGGGGPGFDITSASIGTDDFTDSIFVFSEGLSAFEDADGNTLFGPDRDFILLGDPQGQSIETTFTQTGQNTFANTPEEVLLTRDPAAAQVIATPTPLLDNATQREIPGETTFDSVLATGFATCGAGRTCGFGNASVYVLSSQAIVPGSDLSTVGSFNFSDTNGVSGEFLLADDELSGTVSTSTPFNLNFLFTLNEDGSAAISDEAFAGTTLGTPIAPIAGAVNPESDLVIASAAAVNAQELTEFFGAGDVTPEFARWGFWAASFDVVDAQTGQQGRDNVDLGLFVTGIRPDPGDFANFTGSAGFSGIAVATLQNLSAPGQSDVSNLLAGSFDLGYDFGDRNGTINIDLPGSALDVTGVVNGNLQVLGDPSYVGGIGNNDFSGSVNGVFYTGGNDLVAATGGQFNLIANDETQQAVGVFAGDRVPTIP
ncbi:MAG: FecR domain-containing protein [Pseudomonadota bacterium]